MANLERDVNSVTDAPNSGESGTHESSEIALVAESADTPEPTTATRAECSPITMWISDELSWHFRHG